MPFVHCYKKRENKRKILWFCLFPKNTEWLRVDVWSLFWKVLDFDDCIQGRVRLLSITPQWLAHFICNIIKRFLELVQNTYPCLISIWYSGLTDSSNKYLWYLWTKKKIMHFYFCSQKAKIATTHYMKYKLGVWWIFNAYSSLSDLP